MSEKLGKKKWIVIAVAIVVVIALIIGVVVASSSKNATTEVTGSVDVITKRNIATSINGSGTIETATKEDVTGGTYGTTVETVYVVEGDVIEAGDIICVFDTTDYEEQIADLEQQIKDTEADRKTQNADYDDQIAERETSIAEDLATAKEKLADAETELADAETELARRQGLLDDHLKAGNSEYDTEGANLRSAIDEQESKVQDAKDDVERYENQIEVLESEDASSIEDTKESYNDQVDSAVEQYEEQIENYEEQIEEATIRATISGTITSLNVKEGEKFSGGTIASIEAIDEFIVEAQIDEYDIADVEVGMKVLVKTDSTRDTEMEGVVTYVAARATDSGSSSLSGLSSLMGSDMSSLTGSSSSGASYLVRISLNEQNDRLRLGMNAKVSILTDESVEALSVPYDAVCVRDDGSAYLEVITGTDKDGNYETKEVDVTVGIQGTYYVEVISDKIKEGMEIWIPAAQGTSSISDLLNMMGADAGI